MLGFSYGGFQVAKASTAVLSNRSSAPAREDVGRRLVPVGAIKYSTLFSQNT
jgi:hypothetical protein